MKTCSHFLWFLVSVSHSVQSLSHVQLFPTPWTPVCQVSLSNNNSQTLLKLMSIESVMPSNHLILCHPLLLPSIFPSIRVFYNESVLLIRWPKYWSFSFSISLSNEYSGLITAQDQMILIVILLFVTSMEYLGHPRGLSGKEFACQCKRQVQSLGQEGPLEKEVATHSKKIPIHI